MGITKGSWVWQICCLFMCELFLYVRPLQKYVWVKTPWQLRTNMLKTWFVILAKHTAKLMTRLEYDITLVPKFESEVRAVFLKSYCGHVPKIILRKGVLHFISVMTPMMKHVTLEMMTAPPRVILKFATLSPVAIRISSRHLIHLRLKSRGPSWDP